MQITDLEPQANNAERVNVYVDGRFLLGVNAVIVLRMELRVGQELLPEQLEQLRSEEAEQQAVDRALNYLSFRPRSREMRGSSARAELPLISPAQPRRGAPLLTTQRDAALCHRRGAGAAGSPQLRQ